MKKYYSNFQRYNHRGDRMAIFGELNGDVLEIVVFRCSRKDQFCKQIARNAYELYKLGNTDFYHPEVFTIPVEEGRPKKTFQKWCSKQYYRMIETRLAYPGFMIGKHRYSHKMDAYTQVLIANTLIK